MRTFCCVAYGGFGILLFAGPALTQEYSMAEPAAANPVMTDLVDMKEIDRVDECLDAQVCIDRYLWSLYQRTQKVDVIRVPERVKVAVKRKGKTRIVTRTITKYVVEDFGWKDPVAARRVGMSPRDYVIGGMDRRFRVTLYHALRVLEDAGLMPGITSAFRDDYRQAIASGQKARNDRSFHGGSLRGGYGHGLAADIVSVKGETRAERLESSGALWKWIDAHEKELGIGRPYLDRDAPHVAPLNGKEYAAHRVAPKMHQIAKTQQTRSKAKSRRRLALRNSRALLKHHRAIRRARAKSRLAHAI